MSELTEIPESFRAGTTVKYFRTFALYPVADGWTLTLYLAGASVLESTAVDEAGRFAITLSAVETGSLVAGTYRWAEQVSKDGNVYDVAQGVVTVEANLATAAAGTFQSWAETALAAVEARISGRLPKDMESFQIDGIAVVRVPFDQLLKLRAALQAEVAQERSGKWSRTHKVYFPKVGHE